MNRLSDELDSPLGRSNVRGNSERVVLADGRGLAPGNLFHLALLNEGKVSTVLKPDVDLNTSKRLCPKSRRACMSWAWAEELTVLV